MPFLNASINEIYDFFNENLIRPMDQEESGFFTDFTFLAVDEECIQDCSFSIAEGTGKRPLPKILVCTDAPDFGQTVCTMQSFMRPLADALADACEMEELCATPQELARPKPPPGTAWPNLRVTPFATLTPIEPLTDPENQRFRIATRREAFLRKESFIKKAEAEDWDILKTLDECKG